MYPEDSSWDDQCNRCWCRRGRSVCTRVWCGWRPAPAPAPSSASLAAGCRPDAARLGAGCARLALVVDRPRLALSVDELCLHLRYLAAAQSASWDDDDDDVYDDDDDDDDDDVRTARKPLVVLCDLKNGVDDIVQVTVVGRFSLT